MTRALLAIISLALPAFSQQAAEHSSVDPAFEVATIKHAPQMVVEDIRSGNVRPGFTIDPSQMTARAVSMQTILLRAYSLAGYRLTAPDWTRTQPYFDIVAKIPEGGTKEQVPQMLQSLLKQRFNLVAHTETKEILIYALVVGKNGSKLKPAPDGTPGVFRMTGDPRTVSHLHTVSDLSMLAGSITPYLDRPVLNLTGLKGFFDMELDVTRDPEPGPNPLPLLDFKSAVESLGLKLEPRKEPMEILVVDHLEKIPTEN